MCDRPFVDFATVANAISERRRQRADACLASIEEVAQAFSIHNQALRDQAVADLLKMLASPIDPLELPVLPLRAVGRADQETAWTLWLSAILDSDDNNPAGRALWMAICHAASQSCPVDPTFVPAEGERIPSVRLAQPEDWLRACRSGTRSSRHEVGAPGLGQADLVIETDSMFVVIELKLWATWSDRIPVGGTLYRQADRYRELARQHAPGDKRIGLVLITARQDMRRSSTPGKHTVPPDWCLVHWSDVALAGRSELGETTPRDAAHALLLSPWLRTIGQIEQLLLHLKPLSSLRREKSLTRFLGEAERLANHLGKLT